MRWKSILGLISLVGAIAYGIAIAGMCDSGLFEVPQFKAAFIGFVVGALLWLILSKKLSFFGTFEHELTLGVYPLLRSSAQMVFYPLLGFFTGFHLVSNIMEFEPHQSDIRKGGVVFSVLFCAFAGAVTFGFILAFVISGYKGGLDFLVIGLQNVADVVTGALTLAWRGITGFAPPAK
jgi:hypothetical protein